MKKSYVSQMIGSFIDFKGKEHKVVVVALSEILDKQNEEEYEVDYEITRYAENEDTNYLGLVTKCLKLGYAICNPEDQFNPTTGVKKATARAKESKPVIWASDESMINSDIAYTYMKTLLRYISNSPEKYIKGYKESKLKFEKQRELAAMKEGFNEDQVMLHELLKTLPTEEVDSVLQVVNDLKDEETK